MVLPGVPPSSGRVTVAKILPGVFSNPWYLAQLSGGL